MILYNGAENYNHIRFYLQTMPCNLNGWHIPSCSTRMSKLVEGLRGQTLTLWLIYIHDTTLSTNIHNQKILLLHSMDQVPVW